MRVSNAFRHIAPYPQSWMKLHSMNLQRLLLKDRWPIAEGLISHPEDIDDLNLPLLYWYGVEPLVPADADRVGRSEL